MTSRRLSAIAAELAVVALSIAVAVGLERMFSTAEFRADLIGMIVAAHGLAIVTRRAGFGMAVSALVSAAGLMIVGNILLFPETAGSFLPTRETVDLLDAELTLAWDAFQTQKAPVDPLRGFVVVIAAAMWWIAVLADWAAFRLRSALEAVAPATAMFVVSALLGSEIDQVRHATTFAAAVAIVLLTMRVERQAREEVWVASGIDRGLSASMRVGTGVAAFALVFGAFAGPAVPNAEQQLLNPSDWDNGPGTRRVPSPLVEVSASLINQSKFELFSVRVDDPIADRNYWRLMALTDFNGSQWSVSSHFDDAEGPVPTDVDLGIPRRTVRQEITTLSLGGIYLPAAFEVTNIVDNGGIDLEYEPSTGALVVTRGSEADAEPGFTYILESAVPLFTADMLNPDTSAGVDSAFLAQHTALPPTCTGDDQDGTRCWPSAVTALAEEITTGASTDYERARLLQDHFLDPDLYTYDLDVALGQGVRDTEQFVLGVRRGYCQQFASAFAGMARSLGIPTRLAVGFTWGEYNQARDEYIVRGEHGHVWPEVYFAGVGWVPFDPTPGRAPANGQNLTGLTPAQLNENDDVNRPDSLFPAPVTVPAPSPGRGDPGITGGPNLPPEPETATASEESTGGGGGPSIDNGVLARALIALAVVAMLAGAIPLLRGALHRRRSSMVAADPRGRAELAWDDAADGLRLLDVAQLSSETPHEFAARIRGGPTDVGPLPELAMQVTILRYGRPADPVPHAVAALQASARVVELCRAEAGHRRVTVDQLDPRNLRFS